MSGRRPGRHAGRPNGRRHDRLQQSPSAGTLRGPQTGRGAMQGQSRSGPAAMHSGKDAARRLQQGSGTGPLRGCPESTGSLQGQGRPGNAQLHAGSDGPCDGSPSSPGSKISPYSTPTIPAGDRVAHREPHPAGLFPAPVAPEAAPLAHQLPPLGRERSMAGRFVPSPSDALPASRVSTSDSRQGEAYPPTKGLKNRTPEQGRRAMGYRDFPWKAVSERAPGFPGKMQTPPTALA